MKTESKHVALIIVIAVIAFGLLMTYFVVRQSGTQNDVEISNEPELQVQDRTERTEELHEMIDEFMEENEVEVTPRPGPSAAQLQAAKGSEVTVTEGVLHTVPLDSIAIGCPRQDCIPSIDDPQFESVSDTGEFLADDEIGIAFSFDGIDRFYPFKILVVHELVNDVFNGERKLISYCPLCFSGVVFDPLVNGERVEFGVSGKLWNSNVVMYDRKTETYWSQILGRAIVGDHAGEDLPILPSDMVRFGEWKKAFPQGEVLSQDTGIYDSYGFDPYGDYYTDNTNLFRHALDNPDGDPRLANKEFVLGIELDGQAKAFHPPAVERVGSVTEEFAGRQITAEFDEALRVVRLYEENSDGTRERLNPLPNFWFSWVSTFPDTELYKLF